MSSSTPRPTMPPNARLDRVAARAEARDVGRGEAVVHLPVDEHVTQRVDVRDGHAVERDTRRSRPTPAGRPDDARRRPRDHVVQRGRRVVGGRARPRARGRTTRPRRCARAPAARGPLGREEVERAPFVVVAPPAPLLRRARRSRRRAPRVARSLDDPRRQALDAAPEHAGLVLDELDDEAVGIAAAAHVDDARPRGADVGCETNSMPRAERSSYAACTFSVRSAMMRGTRSSIGASGGGSSAGSSHSIRSSRVCSSPSPMPSSAPRPCAAGMPKLRATMSAARSRRGCRGAP